MNNANEPTGFLTPNIVPPAESTEDFESFLEKREDILDYAAYRFLWLLSSPCLDPDTPVDEKFPWDMSMIGPLLDAAEEILQETQYPSCHPYHDGEEMPCYQTNDCNHNNCPFAPQNAAQATLTPNREEHTK